MLQHSYDDVLRIHAGLIGMPIVDQGSKRFVVRHLDKDIELMGGFWHAARAYNALNENNNADHFAVKHMSAFNELCYVKY